MKRCCSILAAVFFGAGTLLASDVASDFSHANQLYAAGKFSEAAGAYESILNSGVISANLLFNAGNAQFKSGNPGRAIAAYRRAELLAPRDADIRANLDFARNQVQGPTWRQTWWQTWLASLSLNEWAAVAASAFWLAFLLFALLQLRPEWKQVLRGPARGLVVAAIFFCACLAAAAATHFSNSVAVVVLPNAVTRSGPFDDAQNAFAVHDGAELAVLDQRNGWVQVSDASGRTGWMKNSQVELLPAI
ncbi:MAG TPA: SH3 domain-containing protein [Verrucomicrobiae bacterium]|jgi:tetratricopeptide (TPR) repeat protein|nr:SH3 domain-containing protein [Verrucomicrobiae bacterium]